MPATEDGRIFVSYRRQDSDHLAGRLYDRLVGQFGEDQVFIDVDAIDLGVDFADEISRAMAACKVLLAVIGPAWLTATDERGHRRLDDPDDFVRLEIEAALARGVRVIPVLAQGAVMPGRDDLPGSLAGLARRNALFIRHESFRSDAGRLVAAIERVLAAAPGTATVVGNLDPQGGRSGEDALGAMVQTGSSPGTMDMLYVEGGNWGRDDDHPRWCTKAQRRPWRARCPTCKGKGKVQFTFGNCTTCDGRRTVPACKDHETWWVPW